MVVVGGRDRARQLPFGPCQFFFTFCDIIYIWVQQLLIVGGALRTENCSGVQQHCGVNTIVLVRVSALVGRRRLSTPVRSATPAMEGVEECVKNFRLRQIATHNVASRRRGRGWCAPAPPFPHDGPQLVPVLCRCPSHKYADGETGPNCHSEPWALFEGISVGGSLPRNGIVPRVHPDPLRTWSATN